MKLSRRRLLTDLSISVLRRAYLATVAVVGADSTSAKALRQALVEKRKAAKGEGKRKKKW